MTAADAPLTDAERAQLRAAWPLNPDHQEYIVATVESILENRRREWEADHE